MRSFIYNETRVEGKKTGIVSTNEPWTEILLDNGVVLSLRLIVTSVHELVEQKDDAGRPIYFIEHQVVIAPACER